MSSTRWLPNCEFLIQTWYTVWSAINTIHTRMHIHTYTNTRAHAYIHTQIHFKLGFHFYRRSLLRCPDQSAVESGPTHNLTSSWIVLLLRQTYIICFSIRKTRTDHGWGSPTQTCNHISHFSGNLQRISHTHTNGRTHVHGFCNFCNPICSVLLFFCSPPFYAGMCTFIDK